MQSNLGWFFLVALAPQVIGGSREMRSQYIEALPIPNATDAQKAALSDLARACQSAAEARYQKQEALRRRIPDLCPAGVDPKLTKNLKNWWELKDFAAFRLEVNKTFKADIPLAERNTWEDWITRDKAAIATLSAEITALEAQINAHVYALFKLTEEEIRLLEESL
jgi:hypothetical protein